MNKLVLKDISIINKNKDKVTGLKLESKDLKFILYSCENNISEENDNFKKFSFEKFNITSKKKMSNINLTIEQEDNNSVLKINNKNVFYIQDTKPILSDEQFKLILNNGKLYTPPNEKEQENSLVNLILSKNNTIDLNNDKLQETTTEVKTEPVVEESTTTEPVIEESTEVKTEPIVEESSEIKTISVPVIEENTKEVKIEPIIIKEKSNEIKKEKKVLFEKTESDNKNNVILNEIKDIISTNNVQNVKNENITFNIKKIDHNTNNQNNNYNINNILNDLNETYENNDYSIKDVNLNKNNNNLMNVNFFNKKYMIKIHNIISSNLNMYNLSKSKLLKENIINDNKISILLENKNSSYLLNYFNNIYLINRVNNKLLITFLKNKKTIILDDNKFFKLCNFNFYLTFGCKLMIPIINKKIYNNKNGQSMNYFEPNV